MFNLFSAISGKLSSSIITGTCFPVLLFLSFFVWVVEPIAPGILPVPASFQALETQWKVLAVTFALALLTGVLSGVNHLLMRFYANLLVPGAAAYHTRRRECLRHWRDQLDKFGSAGDDARQAAASEAINPILTVLAVNYPSFGPAAPTRLGNIFGNVEDYFKLRYGMSHAIGWWRLTGAMDSPFAAILDDAKASFDFMLNSSFLASLLVLSLLAYAACFGADLLPFLWRVALSALAARLTYLGAVDRAKALGNLERAAIDLFRLNLLTKLGIKYDFTSLADERLIWASLEDSLITPDRHDGPPYQRALIDAPPATSAVSDGQALALLRSTKSFVAARFPSAAIELVITNPGPAASGSVSVNDAIPQSWSYIASSAASSAGNLQVTSADPFSATLDSIAGGDTVTVTYRIQAWKAGNA
ncbi:MAG: hypothetical protein M3Y27_06150 [Acidobacteriota bacterium]|nr:hypothetical protein [Acidobacteriota bacterium]